MELITVREFDDYISAHVIMGRLKDEDIICHLQNEHTITTAPFLSPIFGGIKLMVPASQKDKALALLTKWKDEQGS